MTGESYSFASHVDHEVVGGAFGHQLLALPSTRPYPQWWWMGLGFTLLASVPVCLVSSIASAPVL